MTLSPAALAFIKLGVTFALILLGMRARLSLWLAILGGGLAVALLCGLPLLQWAEIALKVPFQSEFIILEVMIFQIMTLSGVQDATGQSQRLVEGIEQYLRNPRIRLVLFPALVGLLPMPGGALFSCPMLNAAARDLPVPPARKVLINYWFRHIWEVAWPLYPGYILASSLLGLPLSTLARYTSIFVVLAFATGWFFYLRDLASEKFATAPTAAQMTHAGESTENTRPLRRIFLESLPISITLVGAGAFSMLIGVVTPPLPSQFAFIASLLCAVTAALWQGRGKRKTPLIRILLSPNTGRVLLLVFAIFVFKDTIAASGIVTEISSMAGSRYLVYLLFLVLPFIGGLLTGIMVGYVGATFPILISVISQMNMQAEAVPLYILAIISGNCGQLASPLHICLVVSCEYFKVSMGDVWKHLVAPILVQFVYGSAWVGVLYLMGAHF